MVGDGASVTVGEGIADGTDVGTVVGVAIGAGELVGSLVGGAVVPDPPPVEISSTVTETGASSMVA